MNPPSGNDPESFARQKLAQACRAIDRSVRLRWVLIVCQVLVGTVLALALVDYWLMLPTLWRAAGSLALAALVLYGIARLVRYCLRPTHLKQGALAIESKRPELGCEVSTAAEYLSGERKIEHEYEPELAAALEAKTAQALIQSPVVGARLLRFAACLGASLLVLLALALATPGGLTALERTAVPFSKAHYTSVEVRPGDFEVPVGRSADITNIFSGRLPKDARISWAEAANMRWQTAALTRGTQGIYVHTLTNLLADVVYRVAGNDALSADYKITTYIPPAVKDFNIQLSYPTYTKLPVSAQKSPDITAVRATTATIQIRPTVELKQAGVRIGGSNELAMARNPDGTWSGTVPITKDADYWIDLADTKGHSGVNDKPYHIKALPDNPPKVEIADPGKDIRSSATNKVLVKISVSDDFGVDQIKLVYNKLGGTQQSVDAQKQSEHNGEIIAQAELDLSAMELKDYELVAYHAEATDNNTLDGPGIGKSPVYFVEITDEQGKPCLAQGQGQKVNLLVIQKQIIADTTAMAADAGNDKFKEMAVRQRDAAEFGKMYLDAISGAGVEEAQNEMHAALNDMELAGNQLDKQQRSEAIPREESALAHLYQVVKLMPELENMPTTPTAGQKPPSPKVQVVLQAIKDKKKENPDNKELQDALSQARDLARAQAGLNSAMRDPGMSGGKAQAQQASNPGNSNSPGQPNPAQGKGFGQGENSGDKPNDSAEQAQQQQQQQQEQQPGSPAQIADKEAQLSQEAKDLADRLQRIAGKDKRVGHNLGNGANRAAGKMAAAGQAVKAGAFGAAGEHGFQGELAMRNVAEQLERLLKNQPEPTDIAHEDSPKEYDTLISEYLKRLSHAE